MSPRNVTVLDRTHDLQLKIILIPKLEIFAVLKNFLGFIWLKMPFSDVSSWPVPSIIPRNAK